MSSMETAIALTDHASAPLYQISTAVQTVTRELELLRVVSGNAFNTSVFEAARVKLTEQLVPIEQIAGATNEAAEKQEAHNGKMEKGTSLAGKLAGKVKALVGKYANLSTVKDVLGMSDELTQTMTHLDTMVARYNELNGTMQTTTDLSRMIYQSAQSSRTSYLGTAEAVAELGNRAQNAFSSTEEMVGFAELANKQFAIAGLSANESSAAFSQLSEAMGDGVLSGSELSGIFKQAPNLVQTLADYMGVPTSEISELASQGQITADIMKNAMFAAQDEINARFESMPMTWGQVWTMFQNGALMAFQPVLSAISEMTQMKEFKTAMDGVVDAMQKVGKVATPIVEGMIQGAAYIVDNWDMISPAVYGLVTALGAYAIIQALSMAASVAHTVVLGLEAIAYMALGLATMNASIYQQGLNMAMLAFPGTWIIAIIMGIIVAVGILLTRMSNTQVTVGNVFSAICGGINVVLQLFKNVGLFILNILLGIVNMVVAVAANIRAAFHNAIFSVVAWWYSLLSTALEVVEKICVALNKLPFVEFDYSGISVMADDYASKSKEASENKMEYMDLREEFRNGFETFDVFEDGWVSDAYDTGYERGQGIVDKISAFLGGVGNEDEEENLSNIAIDTSNISDSLDISQENLKYLLDLAEQEAINRFTTAEIKVDMSGMQNMVNNTNDLDGIVDGLTTRVIESMEVVKEGV